jgi:hypothetical protein
MAKKGFVYTWKDPSAAAKIKALNADWYYTWSPTPINGLDVPFVPMAWSPKQLGVLAGVKGDTILGFNEPDRSDQSNVSVVDAVRLWPQLTKTGKRVGSCATASNPTKPGWQQDFLSQTNVGVDFITVHWYAPPNAHALLAQLQTLYEEYKKPIWITEFAVADWKNTTGGFPVDKVIEFMKDVLPVLDELPYVEKYSWKTRTTSDVNMGTSALFNDDGSLTDLGKVYAAHGAGCACGCGPDCKGCACDCECCPHPEPEAPAPVVPEPEAPAPVVTRVEALEALVSENIDEE